MSSNAENVKEFVVSRRLTASELRKARRAARDPRNRLLSDSSDEVPRGILKNARVPTKRSASECIDDLSQIIADLEHMNIDSYLSKSTGKYCSHHHQYFNEEEEGEGGDEDDDDDDKSSENNRDGNLECDCNIKYGDNDNMEDRPKKSVRFNEHVYETVFFASRLYDRRNFVKYHFSSRHHPPSNQQSKSKKKRQRQHNSSKSDNKDGEQQESSKLDSNSNGGCKLSKSQRSKQSKKDKKRRLNKKDDTTDTSSDDQGYCSSLHSFSD